MKRQHKPYLSKEDFFTFFKQIPKAELHLHLEAVISRQTIRRFYQRRYPDTTEEQAESAIAEMFTYSDLNGFIQAYLAIQDLYEDPSDFNDVFSDLSDYLVRNGICYAEVFAAPSAFIKKGWDFSELIDTYHRNIVGIKEKTGIDVRLIIDVSRTFGFENAEKNLQLLLAYRCPEIIGIGLGGSEQKGPAKLFGNVFDKARKNGLVTVAHAGEDSGPESIWDTISILHAARIGHGTSAVQDEELMQTLAKRKIPLEVCPTSNVFTQKYVKSISEHPIRTFFDKGIIVTLNSDDPLFFDAELLDEYWNMYSKTGFKLKELKQIIHNSFDASFLDKDKKSSFNELVIKKWKKEKT